MWLHVPGSPNFLMGMVEVKLIFLTYLKLNNLILNVTFGTCVELLELPEVQGARRG